MGNRLTSLFPYDDEESNANTSGIAFHNYTEIFENACPHYMAMGLSFDEFWYGDPVKAKYCREAYKIKKDNDNFKLWLQGKYVYDAICMASPLIRMNMSGKKIEPIPYHKEPFPMSEEEAEARQEREEKKQMEEMRARLITYATAFNANIKEREEAKTDAEHNG